MKFTAEHIGLPARDPVALKNWYVRMLDANVLYDSGQVPPTFFVELPGRLLVEIYEGSFTITETGENGLTGWRHLALRVDSIETAVSELAARGVAFNEPIKPASGGGRVLFFKDGEGNLLHLVERPEDSPFKQ